LLLLSALLANRLGWRLLEAMGLQAGQTTAKPARFLSPFVTENHKYSISYILLFED